jgi:hypothetical protein
MRNVGSAKAQLFKTALAWAENATTQVDKEKSASFLKSAEEYGNAKRRARNKRDAWKTKNRMVNPT